MVNRMKHEAESGELFYIDGDGKRQDASLHADMLDNNPEADAAFERMLAATIAAKKAQSVPKR